jgi:hypothetical protein
MGMSGVQVLGRGLRGSRGLPQLYSPHYEQQEVIRVDPLSVYQFESLLGD